MTNQEKILAMLEGMTARQTKAEQILESMQAEQAAMRAEQQRTNERFDNLEDTLADVRTTVARIEYEHGRQIGLLVDGHMLNAEKLGRIEREVTRHDEIILRRV